MRAQPIVPHRSATWSKPAGAKHSQSYASCHALNQLNYVRSAPRTLVGIGRNSYTKISYYCYIINRSEGSHPYAALRCRPRSFAARLTRLTEDRLVAAETGWLAALSVVIAVSGATKQ